MRRLAEVVEGRLDPAAVVEGALAVVVFLSVVWGVEVATEDTGRLVRPGAGPAAPAVLGRILAAALGLVAPAAGCDAGPTRRRWMDDGWRVKPRKPRKPRKMDKINKNGW